VALVLAGLAAVRATCELNEHDGLSRDLSTPHRVSSLHSNDGGVRHRIGARNLDNRFTSFAPSDCFPSLMGIQLRLSSHRYAARFGTLATFPLFGF
jgi:hypothetical protein